MPRSCLTNWRETCWISFWKALGSHFVERAAKAVFLELRQKHLAMGRIVRCYSNFHLSDAQKLV